MKVLFLNGSHNKAGAVAGLMKAVSQGLEGRAEVDWVDVYDLKMKPCTGCLGCRKDDTECVQPEDDAQIVGRKLREAGALVIGTPTHFGNMSSPLKNLLDRNGTALFTEPHSGLPIPIPKNKGKPAVIVTACSTPWPLSSILGMTSGAIKSVKNYLGVGGFRVIGKLVKPGTAKDRTLAPALLKKAQRLGRRIAAKMPV